ncbi:MAG TPA: dTDP-4-dehydrorhamnose reductase [Persephonella sp.]|nr:dTDP-4-dehydrorhamnose reductase [Hydrogenothermaceae bacterium]HIQ25622.1 dTDP-4-dehydrorhamnose reductase [Persephonella sp.]
MVKYLIIGKNGQLGREFIKTLDRKKKNFVALSHLECDISNLDNVLEVFEKIKPDIVINCAAYNQVDKAEVDYAKAIKVNSFGVRNLSYASRKFNTFLVHYSTDYVFDGKKENGLYTEEDIPNPINEYGKSKYIGEIYLKEELNNYLIFRTSWVYGEGKQNFIYKLMQLVKNNNFLKISYDEISIPTSTRTIVEVSLKALEKGLIGVYHLTNCGYASRYEFAKKILEIKRINKFIYPVSKSIFNLPAERPKFSAMSNEKLINLLNLEINKWDEELKIFIYQNK